jgi:hypothetical protein
MFAVRGYCCVGRVQIIAGRRAFKTARTRGAGDGKNNANDDCRVSINDT